MPKTFSTKEASNLLKANSDLRKALLDAVNIPEKQKAEIGKALHALRYEEVLRTLQGVPVEEINRDKLGIRVKALRDAGFATVADVANATVYQLAAVYGISEEGAQTIRRVVDNYVKEVQKGTRVRLSLDDRTRGATALVETVALYLRLMPMVDECARLYQSTAEEQRRLTADLAPAANGLTWLFTSRQRKDAAEAAYRALDRALYLDYGTKARGVLNEIYYTSKNMSPMVAWQDFQNQSIKFITTLEKLFPGALGDNDTVYGLPDELAVAVRDQALFPNGLLVDLRPYQEWGVKYILHQERVLLGDEMGLGKTVEAIAAMVSLKNTGATHFLVVCPASVLTNWCREVSGKSRLSVTKVHGALRELAFDSWLRTGGVAVTTYETTGLLKFPDNYRFSMLVVDEAHYVKNAEAQRTANVKRIASHAERLLFMTGTALENRVDEMVSLISMLQPAIARSVRGMKFMPSAPQFREKVAPVYFRRKREEVMHELPEITESKEWCTLLPLEEMDYEWAVMNRNYMEARRVSWNARDIRQSSKARRMMELVEEAAEDGRKILVFSFFLETITRVRELLGDRCIGPITGAVTPARRQEIIDEFDRAPAGTVLVSQIISGGTGLNIQSASVVILCEPQLKPSIENQAIARAYRMGQARNVLVYRLLADDTIDERIIDLLAEKQAVFDAFADKSEAAKMSLELDAKSFGDIIQEEIDRINEKKHGS